MKAAPWFFGLSVVVAIASCADEDEEVRAPDTGAPDAARDTGADVAVPDAAGRDAVPDAAGPDTGGPGDAAPDAGPDAGLARTAVQPAVPTLPPELVPVDFDTIEGTTLTLFYPGQASYSFLRGGTQPGVTRPHGGAAAVRAGTPCRACHAQGGTAPPPSQLGALALANLDQAPIPDKPPTLDVTVKFAFDDEFVYVQAVWEGDADPGDVHAVRRFDGATGRWVNFGGPRNPTADPPIYEDRFTFLFGQDRTSAGFVEADNGAASGFQEHGCFITCHNGMRDMPLDAAGSSVIPTLFPGQRDMRKYLLITREAAREGDPAARTGVTEEEGRWALLKSPADLATLKSQGKFLDHFHWRAARTNPIGFSDDTFVFDYRRGDAGRAAFREQEAEDLNEALAGRNNGNAFMWNPATVPPTALNGGQFAIRGGTDPLAALKLPATTHVLAEVDNTAIPYDSTRYTPQNNDLLLADILQPPDGSHADILADGRWSLDPVTGKGRWTVVLRRRLDTGNPADDHKLEEGKIYPIAFSVHDDNVTTRHHYVSLEQTLAMGAAAGPADIVAVKVPGR